MRQDDAVSLQRLEQHAFHVGALQFHAAFDQVQFGRTHQRQIQLEGSHARDAFTGVTGLEEFVDLGELIPGHRSAHARLELSDVVDLVLVSHPVQLLHLHRVHRRSEGQRCCCQQRGRQSAQAARSLSAGPCRIGNQLNHHRLAPAF